MINLSYTADKSTSIKLLNLELINDSDVYYLSATYRIEDEHTVREVHIPKLWMGFLDKYIRVQTDDRYMGSVPQADIGFGYRQLSPNRYEDDIFYTETVIEEKTHEMTLDEIEKKLGYKVKIINMKE